MIEIEVKKQRQLTLQETFDFCLSSIRHRFMRSLLTLSVIVLAVAFFMYLQSQNIFQNSVKDGVELEIIRSREPARIISMIYTPFTLNEFIRLIADCKTQPQEFDRSRAVLGLSKEDMDFLVDSCYDDLFLQRFLESLPIGKRKELFGRISGHGFFELLSEPGKLDEVKARMLMFGGTKFPGGNLIDRFISNFRNYDSAVKEAHARWGEFQAKVKTGIVTTNDPSAIRQMFLMMRKDKAIESNWLEMISKLGYSLSGQELSRIYEYQTMADLIDKIHSTLSNPEYIKKWRKQYGSSYQKMQEKMSLLDRETVQKYVLDGAPLLVEANVTPAQLNLVAEEYRNRKNLANLELLLNIDIFNKKEGFSPAQLYLIILSFLVCVVGITNAMLMSITERFREIATLKCLGATDSFILIQIVLEAMIQGLIGSFCGVIIGFFVSLVSSYFQIGGRIFETFSFSAIFSAALFSLVAGVLLAMLSSLYPSLRAARMAPMEAMRVE